MQVNVYCAIVSCCAVGNPRHVGSMAQHKQAWHAAPRYNEVGYSQTEAWLWTHYDTIYMGFESWHDKSIGSSRAGCAAPAPLPLTPFRSPSRCPRCCPAQQSCGPATLRQTQLRSCSCPERGRPCAAGRGGAAMPRARAACQLEALLLWAAPQVSQMSPHPRLLPGLTCPWHPLARSQARSWEPHGCCQRCSGMMWREGSSVAARLKIMQAYMAVPGHS